jgi:prepilin-type N-terminal cleavage/methylation domain-containing protein
VKGFHRSNGFTLLELLVVIAITAVLASLLLPAAVRSKALAKNARCASNLRQIHLALEQYTSEFIGKFPYTESYWSTLMFLEYYPLTTPYLKPTEKLYVCPADKGPWNMTSSIYFAIRPRELPLGSSYEYHPSFYTPDGFIDLARQRLVNEVKYPSQKTIVSCLAINSGREVFGQITRAQGHARECQPMIFVDGHSATVKWTQFQTPTNQPRLFDWTPLDWMDVR